MSVPDDSRRRTTDVFVRRSREEDYVWYGRGRPSYEAQGRLLRAFEIFFVNRLEALGL